MLPPVEFPLRSSAPPVAPAVCKDLGIPAGGELLVTMCRVTWVKRLELAVEALAAALPQRPQLWLAVCGGDRNLPGPRQLCQRTLRAVAERLGVAHRLLLPGDVESLRVKEFLAAADLQLAPSWVDTFNYGVVEAALVGTWSLMSTGVGATPWIVDYGAGQRGGVPSRQAWAAAILAALAAPPTQETRYAGPAKA
jgi:glycosyltransferase involved in cell wall biosynthesis